jgi:SAM-dependent methyltransferase
MTRGSGPSGFERFHGDIVDIGCGDGRVRHSLPRDAEYLGLDYYKTAVEWYDTRPDIFGDAASLPLPDESVDGVIMLHVLEHLEAADAALDEVARIMRPGALGVIEVPFIYPIHDAPRDFRRWTQYGLPVVIRERGLRIDAANARGRAIETAALLFNLAISRLSIDWIRRRSGWLVVAPLLWLLIPLQNLVGATLAPLYPDSNYMPFSIRVAFRKPLEKSDNQ